MAKKLGKCARCPTKLTPGHFHNLSGVRLCDNCYPFDKDPENGKLVYKKHGSVVPPEVITEAQHKIVLGSAIPTIPVEEQALNNIKE